VIEIGPTITAGALSGARLRSFAERVARVTRRGYRRPEPLPGLPAADGAFDRAKDVLADLERGGRVTLARVSDVDAGAIRVLPGPDGGRYVRRLAVDGAFAGRRIGELLLREVEREAGTATVTLDAVVERCVPPFYARLGYRTVRHWRSDDKPLTEVTMRRRAGGPAGGYAHPWQGDDVTPEDGVLVCYVRWRGLLVAAVTATGGRCAEVTRLQAARVGRALGPDPGLRCVGADHVPAGAGAFTEHLRRSAHEARGGVLVFAGPVPAYLTPRAVEPRALAWWRMPAGVRVPGHA
jgi:GNAT superfamily N-acetyltransferase